MLVVAVVVVLVLMLVLVKVDMGSGSVLIGTCLRLSNFVDILSKEIIMIINIV